MLPQFLPLGMAKDKWRLDLENSMSLGLAKQRLFVMLESHFKSNYKFDKAPAAAGALSLHLLGVEYEKIGFQTQMPGEDTCVR